MPLKSRFLGENILRKKKIWVIFERTFDRSICTTSLSSPSSPPLSPSTSSGVWYIDPSALQSLPTGRPRAKNIWGLYSGEYSVSTSAPLASVITQLRSTSTSISFITVLLPRPRKPERSCTGRMIAPQLTPTQNSISFEPFPFSRLIF